MISLEQVKLLETKVSRAIDYVKKVTDENSSLKGKLDSYQKRIDELEVLVQQFKEEQNRIEDGILSALDRLNQFEDALERTLAAETTGKAPESAATTTQTSLPAGKIPEKKEKAPAISEEEPVPQPVPAQDDEAKSSEELDIF